MWLLDLVISVGFAILSQVVLHSTELALEQPFDQYVWIEQACYQLSLALAVSVHLCLYYWRYRGFKPWHYAYLIFCPVLYALTFFWVYYGAYQVIEKLLFLDQSSLLGFASVYAVYSLVSSLHGFAVSATQFILLIPQFRIRMFDLIFPPVAEPNLLNEEQIKSLPVYSAEIECAICNEDPYVCLTRKLSCSHEFHAQCIDPWLLKHSNSCPSCRMPSILL